jgi:uncharacterized protein (DUF1499 family)
MNDNHVSRPRGTRWCSVGTIIAGIGAVLLILGLAGGRTGLLPTMLAFMAYGIANVAFAVSILVILVGILLSKGTAASSRTWTLFALAIVVIGMGASKMRDSSGAPGIHDITTDVNNPPAFNAIVELRKDAPNPPEYAGADTAKQQQDAFPNLTTLEISKPANEVFLLAQQAAADMGWEIVAVDVAAGIIEATATTTWFRFKDDVVIRISASGMDTTVDVRSKSRVGQGDMGANARRIRVFLEALNNAAG